MPAVWSRQPAALEHLPAGRKIEVGGWLLERLKAPESWLQMVSEVTQLDAADESRVFGDSLPPGLRLLG